MKKYIVYTEDYFRFMDEDCRFKYGEYETIEDATDVCRKIVEEDIKDMYEDGMSEKDLVIHYHHHGRDAWIFGAGEALFSSKDYFHKKVEELFSEK